MPLSHSPTAVLGFSLAALVLPLPALANAPSWHQYVRAPKSSIVRPARILPGSAAGDIGNADGLVAGRGDTVLSRAAGSDKIPTLIIDFGQNVVGQLLLEFAGSTNGSNGGFPGLELAFSESLEFLTNRSDYTRSDRARQNPPKLLTTGTDQVAVKNYPYTWEDIWGCEFGTKVCSDGLHGFRYVRISLDAVSTDAPFTSADGQVEIASVGLRWSGFLGTPDTYTGWFECSDPVLTQWWFDGVHTVEMGIDYFLANNTEPRDATSPSLLGKLIIQDGAKRDRDPYVGDLAVSSLTSYLSHDTSEATLNILEDLAAHQRDDGWIPPASINNYTLTLFDYPMYWITCSWDYVFYTGRKEYILAHYDVMTKTLDKYYEAHWDLKSGLLVRQDGYGDFAFLPRPGSAAYYSALYVIALNKAAELADLVSKSQDAVRWRVRAAEVSKGFHATLWDPSVSAYFDRKCDNCTAHAQDGNSLAILAGIPNAADAAAALEYLAKNNARFYGNTFYDAGGEALEAGFSNRVYAFLSYFEGAARFETGDTAGALDMIHRTYGWMSREDPGITHWEGIGVNGTKYEGAVTSLAHGWSTGVTPLLTNYILGVKPTKPGFEEWVVDPTVVEGMSWVRGVVPTPYGPLRVSWERRSEDYLVISVDAPEHTIGRLGGPVSRARVVQAGGGKTVATLERVQS